MNTSRRKFFTLLTGGVIGIGAADIAIPAPKNEAASQMNEVQSAFDSLKKQMEQPIHITMVIDGKTIAQRILPHLPATLRQKGIR